MLGAGESMKHPARAVLSGALDRRCDGRKEHRRGHDALNDAARAIALPDVEQALSVAELRRLHNKCGNFKLLERQHNFDSTPINSERGECFLTKGRPSTKSITTNLVIVLRANAAPLRLTPGASGELCAPRLAHLSHEECAG